MVDKISQLNIGKGTVVQHDCVSEISEEEFHTFLQSLSKEDPCSIFYNQQHNNTENP
jgi:hypothetical protein